LENNLYGENSDKSTWGRVCCSSFWLVFGRYVYIIPSIEKRKQKWINMMF
jgi:hypothetical protein